MKASFATIKKHLTLSLGLISSILILFISITGCSDVPYTGPMLTVGHVDQYLNTIEPRYRLSSGWI